MVLETCLALDAARISVDSRHAPVVVVPTVPAAVYVVCFEYFFAPTGVDGQIEVGDEVAMEAESVVDAVAIGREGVRNEDVGTPADDFGAVEEDVTCPCAAQGVGDGDLIASEGIGRGGKGVGGGGAVESVGIGPTIASSRDGGNMEVGTLVEVEEGFVGPDA